MKKFLASVMALAMILSLITVPTFAAPACASEPGDNWYFHTEKDETAVRRVLYGDDTNPESGVMIEITATFNGASDYDKATCKYWPGLYFYLANNGDYGTPFAGYDAINKKLVVGVGGTIDGKYFGLEDCDLDKSKADFDWGVGETHVIKIVQNGRDDGNVVKISIDGELKLTSIEYPFLKKDKLKYADADDAYNKTLCIQESAWDISKVVIGAGSGAIMNTYNFNETTIDSGFVHTVEHSAGYMKKEEIVRGTYKYTNAGTNHTWVDATCTTPRTCSTCGKAENVALGHIPDRAAPTCTEAQLCTRENCPNDGKVIAAATGHSWKEATCVAPKTCQTCGATEGNVGGHDWKDATCTAPKTCQICKETEGEALGHDYGSTVCGQAGTCSRCNESVDAVPHVTDRSKPDCTHPVLCTRENCSEEGKVVEAALGHNFTIDATCTTAKKCDRCGADDPENGPLGHRNLVHNRCGVCGRIAGTQDGPKSNYESNLKDYVIYTDATSTASNMVTKDKYNDFAFVMNVRLAKKNDDSTIGIFFNQATQASAYYNVDLGKFVIAAVKDGAAVNLAVSDATIELPADGVKDIEIGLKRVGNKVTVYVDGVVVATAEDEVLAGESYLIPNFNGNAVYIDYVFTANEKYYFSEEDEGYADYLAAEIEAGRAKEGDIRTRYKETIKVAIHDGVQQYDEMFAQWNNVEKKATLPDDWVRFGYLPVNYNTHRHEWNTAEDYVIMMDVVFMSADLMDSYKYGAVFHNFVGNTNGDAGIGVGYDFINKVAYIKDVKSGYEMATKEFEMPMDEIVQWVVRLTNVKEEYTDNDGNIQYDDSTKVELIINGEVVVEATDPDLAHQGDNQKRIFYRNFNVKMRIRGFNFTNDVENYGGLATPHAGGSATCSELAVCEECGKTYGALAPDVHTVEEYTYNDDATCQKAGTKTGTCKDCGEEVTVADEDHPQTDHNYEDGVCTMCGAAEPVSFIWGDVDGSGKVDSKDKVLASRYLAKWAMDDNFNKDAIDFDKDGQVKAADAVVLARYLAKWTNLPYPVGEPATNS